MAEKERERVREIKHLSIHQWLRSVILDSQEPTLPIGFLFLKLPPPPCAVLLVPILSIYYPFVIHLSMYPWLSFLLPPGPTRDQDGWPWRNHL